MKVGIIGAGTMGSGIAQAFAQTEGYEVFLCDINEQFAANGKSRIAKGFEKRIAKFLCIHSTFGLNINHRNKILF